MRALLTVDSGTVPFQTADAWQRELHRLRLRGEVPDVLLLLEHPHVYTLGRSFEEEHLVVSRDWLQDHGIEVCEADRGGSITYHGPGQLVAYPIVDLRRTDDDQPDVIVYLRTLEEAVIRTAKAYGVVAGRRDGMTGVWVGDAKLASIGVNISRGVSRHGLALNVATDLSYFDGMVPCGLTGVKVTSLEEVLRGKVQLASVGAVLAGRLAELLHRRVVWGDAAEFGFGDEDDDDRAARVIPLRRDAV